MSDHSNILVTALRHAASTLILSILAGICIGIGGWLFLSIDNKIIGSLFFTLGLFTICTRGFMLFTGKVGYVFENPPSYIIDLVIIWIGNFIGTNLTAFCCGLTKLHAPAFIERVELICLNKIYESIPEAFILAIFCNILMFIAVDGFKKNPHETGKYLGLFLCVAGFILAGFEHCVANMFYFALADYWAPETFLYLFVMTAGNIVGGIFIPLCTKLAAVIQE